jgi:hypothetical protein
MAVIHRTFAGAFNYRSDVHGWGTQAPAVAAVRPDRDSPRITAAPWEGLYLEVEDVDNTVADGLPTDPELVRFLASLMYGE